MSLRRHRITLAMVTLTMCLSVSAHSQVLQKRFQRAKIAVLEAPKERANITRFTRLWMSFDRQGLFNHGTSIERVVRALGEPDNGPVTPRTKRLRYAFMSLYAKDGRVQNIVDMRGIDPKTSRLHERLRWKLGADKAWKPGYVFITARKILTEYVRKDERVQNWRELLTVEQHRGTARRMTAQTFASRMHTALKLVAAREGADFEWDYVERGGDRVMYSFAITGGRRKRNECEVAIVIAGPEDMHRLSYGTRSASLEDSVRTAWIDTLRKARVVKTAAGSRASATRVAGERAAPAKPIK